MSIDLESIINQSFNDEYNRMSTIPLGNTEAKNVNDIFMNIDNITECMICCDDDKPCIKCFQCTAYYCKGCLIKIASDFNKCSSCSVNLKENYKKLKEYNEELQETLQYEKAIANSLNEYTKNVTKFTGGNGNRNSNNDRNSNHNNNHNDTDNIYNSDSSDSSDEEEQVFHSRNDKPKNNAQKNNSKNEKNKKTNLKPSLMNLFKTKNKSGTDNLGIDNAYSTNSANHANNAYTTNNRNHVDIYNNTSNIIDTKQEFIRSLREDKIYNINFTSYITEISVNKPNYTYEWNHINNTLSFYSLCNQNNDFISIVVNYNILKATFQSVLYIWLNEIVKCSMSMFKIKWNKIATKINNISSRTDEVTNQEIKKITREIVNICKN